MPFLTWESFERSTVEIALARSGFLSKSDILGNIFPLPPKAAFASAGRYSKGLLAGTAQISIGLISRLAIACMNFPALIRVAFAANPLRITVTSKWALISLWVASAARIFPLSVIASDGARPSSSLWWSTFSSVSRRLFMQANAVAIELLPNPFGATNTVTPRRLWSIPLIFFISIMLMVITQ